MTTSQPVRKESASPPTTRRLLKAEYHDIVAANFQIDPAILEEYLPRHLELDDFNGDTYVTLMAMVVRKVNMLGLPRYFCELSLRFYVRRTGPIRRKGTCFLKNYVSSPTGAWVLSSKFGRPFQKIKITQANSGFRGSGVPEAVYNWQVEENVNKLRVKARSPIKNDGLDTKVGFILSHTNHYESIKGKTFEYRVKRPNWVAWDAAQANFTCDVKRLFGPQFVKPLARRPASVFVTAGSEIEIFRPIEITN